MKGIEIPFGAKDSELCGWEYTIPEGMEAVVKDGKVIVRRKESEDERIRKAALEGIEYLEHKLGWDFIGDTDILDVKEYLERQKEQKPVARKSDFVSNPKTSVEILRHYLVWAENSEEDCPYTWKTLADAISDGIKALEEQKPEEKQEYSGLNDLERAIHRGFLSAGVENVSVTIIKETAQDCLSQMKPAEWSEEDKKFIKHCAELLDGLGEPMCAIRLESLLARSLWKPSEMQLEGGCSEKPNDLLSEQEPTCKDYTHFADVGKMEQPEVDLEKAARNVYESMDDVRRDMVELGKVLNARKED